MEKVIIVKPEKWYEDAARKSGLGENPVAHWVCHLLNQATGWNWTVSECSLCIKE